MQNKFFGSKLNSVLLLILIILMIIALRWMYQDKERYLPNNQAPAETLQFGEDQSTIEYNNNLNSVKDTYTYTNHGFSIELPKGYIPKEYLSDENWTLILLPEGDDITYVSDVSKWNPKKGRTEGYTDSGEEKIEGMTFRVYEYKGENDAHTLYVFKQGNVAYILGDRNIIKSFKFVGWPQVELTNKYIKNGLSFNYLKDTKEKTLNGTFGQYHEIGIPGDNYYPDTLYFFKGEVPKDASMCRNVENKTMVINGKTFIYCDSKAEPYRTYIYKKEGKTVIVGTMLVGDEKMKTYIDLGSIEIE